jgi:hypothetical protein
LAGVYQTPVSMHIHYLWASPSVLNLFPTPQDYRPAGSPREPAAAATLPLPGSLPTTIMSWLLPVAIVLLASLALAAAHFFFTRALARLSEPARTDPADVSDNPAP